MKMGIRVANDPERGAAFVFKCNAKREITFDPPLYRQAETPLYQEIRRRSCILSGTVL
jgi:hypothetical protein